MANKRSSDHLGATSALPPTGDIRWPMSVIVPISSALPPAPDVGGTPGECLKLTFHLRQSPSILMISRLMASNPIAAQKMTRKKTS